MCFYSISSNYFAAVPNSQLKSPSFFFNIFFQLQSCTLSHRFFFIHLYIWTHSTGESSADFLYVCSKDNKNTLYYMHTLSILYQKLIETWCMQVFKILFFFSTQNRTHKKNTKKSVYILQKHYFILSSSPSSSVCFFFFFLLFNIFNSPLSLFCLSLYIRINECTRI
jgi:hypothetical protein